MFQETPTWITHIMHAHRERFREYVHGDGLVPLELAKVYRSGTAAIPRSSSPGRGVDSVDAAVDEELEEAVLTVGETRLKA